MLSQDIFPEDMAAMVVMEAMEAMAAMAVDTTARGRPKLDMAVMAVAMAVMEDMAAMAVDMEAMDIMVNCYNCFSFPPLTSSINWPQDTKAE